MRPKKLDIGSYINVHVIRDNAKRMMFERHEAERYGENASTDAMSGTFFPPVLMFCADKLSVISFATQRYQLAHVLRPSCSSHKCPGTPGRR